MSSAFASASSFSTNLCPWGSKFATTPNTASAFASSGCPDTGDPDFSNSPVGPFCHSCATPAPTPVPTLAPTPAPTLPGCPIYRYQSVRSAYTCGIEIGTDLTVLYLDFSGTGLDLSDPLLTIDAATPFSYSIDHATQVMRLQKPAWVTAFIPGYFGFVCYDPAGVPAMATFSDPECRSTP